MLLEDVVGAQRNRVVQPQEDHLSDVLALCRDEDVVETLRAEVVIGLSDCVLSIIVGNERVLGKLHL